MTDLNEEIRDSFKRCTLVDAGVDSDNSSPVVALSAERDLPPGFEAAKEWHDKQVTVFCRRGYRKFAGSTMPTQADELGKLTVPVMMPLLVTACTRAFADGVQIGHQYEQQVKISAFFGRIDELFENREFRERSANMAQGFLEDHEVNEFFKGFVGTGTAGMAHVTGFAHREAEPNKIWDLWMLAGSSMVSAGYMAGHMLGAAWRERDVLTGIEIATEEGTDGPAPEDD
jgi:hypothetical protein